MTDAPIHDLTIEVLKGIRSDLAGLRDEVHQGFKRLETRFDNLLLGEHGQEHARLREVEGRLAACEESIKELREHLARDG